MDGNTETVNIIYASNDGYACHLAASLASLLDHSKGIPSLDIYVLSVGMCREFKERLKEMASSFGRRLFAVELGDLRQRFDYDIDTRGFDISAMGRLFAPKVLPEYVKRALYLDCDTIINGSILPVYGTDMGSCLVGMVMEPTVYREMKESIGLGKEDPYYNSGVLLMDLEGWRREHVLEQLLEFYGKHEGRLFACDQDTINGALRGRIFPLPPRYNYFTNYRYFHYDTLVSLCPAYERIGREAYRLAGRAPVVIHYLGDERPWIAGNHNHFRRLYEYYLGRTPWKGMEKQRGKEGYMQLWWVFNHVSFLCPPIRLWVSRRLGMKVIDSRKDRGKGNRKDSRKGHRKTCGQGGAGGRRAEGCKKTVGGADQHE